MSELLSVQMSAQDLLKLYEAVILERDSLKSAVSELSAKTKSQDKQISDLTIQNTVISKQRDDLRQQLYQERLHDIEGSMYLHELDRGDKTLATGPAKSPDENTKLIKFGVVSYNNFIH